MRYISLILRLIVFVILLIFSLLNLDHVNITLWNKVIVNDVPVIFVIFFSFILGVIFHWLCSLPTILKLRSKNYKLQKEIINLKNIDKL